MRVHTSPPVAASYATVAKLPELLPPARLVPVTKTVAPLRLAAIAAGTSSPLRGPLYVATQSSPLLVRADAPDDVRLPLQDHVQHVAGLALVDDGLTGRDALLHPPIQHEFARLLRQ